MDKVENKEKKGALKKVSGLGKKLVGARPDGSLSGTKITGTVAMGFGGVGLARGIYSGDIVSIVLAVFTCFVGAVLRFFNPIDEKVTGEEQPTETPEITAEEAVAAGAPIAEGLTYDAPFLAVMKQGHLELSYPEDQWNNLVSKHKNSKLKGADRRHWDMLSRWAKKSLVEAS